MASDKYQKELSYLQEYARDCLREVEYLIHITEPCALFEARLTADGKNCRHCAHSLASHNAV